MLHPYGPSHIIQDQENLTQVNNLNIVVRGSYLNEKFLLTGYRLNREEASVVAKLRNDEKLLEGIISEGKLVNQERSVLKVGQTLKVDVPALHPPPSSVSSASRANDVEVGTAQRCRSAPRRENVAIRCT